MSKHVSFEMSDDSESETKGMSPEVDEDVHKKGQTLRECDLAERVVIITGANSGIGAGIALHLAKIGYKRLALLARREHKLKEVAVECRGLGASDVLVLAKDLFNEESSVEAVKEVVDHFGRLDIVICNAGGGGGSEMIKHKSTEDFRRTIELNLIAPFIMTREAIPHLEKTRGNILFVSSIAGSRVVAGYSDYCAAKASIEHFCRCVASEEAARGIRANVLAPGVIVTEGQTKGKTDSESFNKVRDGLKNYQPIGRVGEVEEMAALVAFLISDQNRFMTGSTITSDGGIGVDSRSQT